MYPDLSYPDTNSIATYDHKYEFSTEGFNISFVTLSLISIEIM